MKSENYGDAEFLDEQARLTDLVPIRTVPWLLASLAGLGLVAALVGLDAWTAVLDRTASRGAVAAFALEGQGNLATWFGSMTLAAAGLAAILVYLVRQHKIDDFHGYYRVWLWAALCWFLLSADRTAGKLHAALRDLMVRLTGTPIVGDGSIWWMIAYGFLIGGVGIRLLIDMAALPAFGGGLDRRRRLPAAFVLAVHLGFFPAQWSPREILIEVQPCSPATCCSWRRWACTPAT